MQREAPAGAVMQRDGGARLHGVDDEPAVDEPDPRHVRGRGESRRHLLGVAIVIVERQVARRVVVELRRARLRRRSASVTAGSGSMSSVTASAASLACVAVSATTQATGSPTKRTLSAASAGRDGCVHRGAVAVLERQGAFERAVAASGRRPYRRRARPAWLWRPRVDAADDPVRLAAAHHHGIGLAGKPRSSV